MLSERKGFTLIELLIVVVVIGVLAAIALPKFGQTRERAFYSTMRSDLNNLRSAQEQYFHSTGQFTYATSITSLDLTLSRGVTIPTMNVLNNGQAWEAVANHTVLPEGACVIGFGEIGSESWGVSGGAPAVTVTADNAGAPVCNDS